MQSGQVLICVDEASGLTFGQKYVADTTCNALGKVTLVGQQGLYDFNSFIKPFQKIPAAGEWWVTRAGVVVLVNHVDHGQIVVAVPSGDGGIQLELFYESGRYSQSAETERDLICLAGHGDWHIGDRVNLSRSAGVMVRLATVREVSYFSAVSKEG